jgi:hypothetical protein
MNIIKCTYSAYVTQIFIYVEMFESPPDKSSPECININIIKIVKNTTEIRRFKIHYYEI